MPAVRSPEERRAGRSRRHGTRRPGRRACRDRRAPCLRAAVFALTVVLLLVPGPIHAQDVSARAYLSSSRVGVGQYFVLNVEISGTQRLDQEPRLPDMSDFASFVSSGSSTSVQIVNGRTTLSVTLQYRFQATTEGSFEIGPVGVSTNGQTLTTEPLEIVVSQRPPAPSPTPAQPPGGADTGGNDITTDDLFVTAEPDKRRVYENEPVVVEYRIYARVPVTSYSVTELPGTAGFWAEEFEQNERPRAEQVVRDGQQYATALLRKVALFPTGPGTRTLEPLTVEAQVRVRRRSLDAFEDLFSRGSLFGSLVPIAVASSPVEIEVLPLPGEGRSADFTGFVGELDLSASLDRDSVETNEAVTLSIEVSGTGNLRALPEPDVDLPPAFEAFPPEVTERIRRDDRGVSGTRTYEYVLIPRVAGTRTIPTVRLSYFDLASGEYETATTDPLSLAVTGAATEATGVGGVARAGVEELRTDIRFIDIAEPRLVRTGRSLFREGAFWAVLLLPMAVVLGATGIRRHRSRLEGDVAYARRRRARRVARTRLAQAKALVARDDPREFYAEAGRALQGFLADRLNVSEAGMIRDEVGGHMTAGGVAEEVVAEYLACLAECDRQRFAPPLSDAGQRAAFLARVESAMGGLARELSR